MLAAVYCRVSTKAQAEDGSSLETQARACVKAAEQSGFTVRRDFVYREDWPGDSLDRPMLGTVRDLIRKRVISALYCYATDRLSRNAVHLYILAEECDKAGVSLHFVTEPLDNSPEGQLIGFVKGYAAQIEREKIRERTVRGKQARAAEGKLPQGTGRGAYGYRYDTETGRRRIAEFEAGVVRRIFKLVSEGQSIHRISVVLNEEGIPSQSGSKWYALTVRRLVMNPMYMGVTYYGRTRSVSLGGRKRRIEPKDRSEWVEIEDATPAIVSREEFQEAQFRLENTPRRRTGKPTQRYLLTGHIVCGYCGTPMSGSILSGNSRRYYYCRQTRLKADDPQRCQGRYVRADDIEESVMRELSKVLERPDVVLAELLKRQDGGSPQLEIQIREIENELKACEDQEKRLIRLYRFGEIDDDFIVRETRVIKEREERMRHEVVELKNRLENLSRLTELAPKVQEVCKRVREAVAAFGYDEQLLVLNAFSIKVVATTDKVEIRGAMPTYVTIERTSA